MRNSLPVSNKKDTEQCYYLNSSRLLNLLPLANEAFGKVMFLHMSANLSGGGERAWEGGHCDWGGGTRGRGACMAGDMCGGGGGHAWLGGGVHGGGGCVTGETTTAAGGTPPTGMHSCYTLF